MRKAIAGACLLTVLTACADENSKPANTAADRSTMTTTVASSTSTSIPQATTSTGRPAEDRSPGESIGVTDSVTIVVLDPEEDG